MEDRELYSRFISLTTQAKPLLDWSQSGGNHSLTPHGLSHISAVETNYNWLISDFDLANSFNIHEIFCLLCATYFHDAYMIPQKLGTEKYTRKNHAFRAEQQLTNNRHRLSLSFPEAMIIAEIIKGHADYAALNTEPTILVNTPISVKKLAACLSIADLCHADASRAPEIVLEYLDLDEESMRHWGRHLQISGIARSGDDIIISAFYLSDEGRDAINEYKKFIENQLSLVYPYFQSILAPIKGVRLNARSIDETGLELQFKTNTESLLNTFIEEVYNREDAFIRELAQNSLDACTLAQAKADKLKLRYKPIIVLSLLKENDKTKAIRIDDNGIGMSAFDIRDTVLMIGSSVSDKKEVKQLLEDTIGKDLIAKFGIGLLSCFKVALSIKVITQKDKEKAIQFEVLSTRDRINLELATDNSTGTTFIIELNDAIADGLRMEESIAYYLRMIDQVDLYVLNLKWTDQSKRYSRMEIFDMAAGNAFPIDGMKMVQKLKSQVAYCKIEGDGFNGWFAISIQDNNSLKLPSEGKITVLSEGVFVSVDSASEWLPESLNICDGVINFSAQSIELPLSRDKVKNNAKNSSTKRNIASKLMDRIIQNLVQRTRNDFSDYESAVLILSFIYKKANEQVKKVIFQNLGQYCVFEFSSRDKYSLNALIKRNQEAIYLEYPAGRWVSDLSSLKGKQLYHKTDDLTKMRAANLKQNKKTVISTNRFDSQIAGDTILEADMLIGYFKSFGVKTVDLCNEKIRLDTSIARNLHKEVRDQFGEEIEFHYVGILPETRAWNMGEQIWLNLANDDVKKLFSQLQSGDLSVDGIKMCRVLVHIWAWRFDDAIENLRTLILIQKVDTKPKNVIS
jgi:hypothetical protein